MICAEGWVSNTNRVMHLAGCHVCGYGSPISGMFVMLSQGYTYRLLQYLYLTPCPCCRARVSMPVLPCPCCRARVAVPVLPCPCCRARVTVPVLPCPCCLACDYTRTWLSCGMYLVQPMHRHGSCSSLARAVYCAIVE